MIHPLSTDQLVLFDAASADGETFAWSAEIEMVELADGRREPPREIRILKNGTNETTKGPIVCDAAAAKATIAAAVAHYGKPVLNFDYGHGQVGFMGSYESARSAGWFELQERNGDLYAANIEWTPTAKKALADREFRYISPALMRDFESGKIKSLINVALTNIPATKGQKPLVTSQGPEKETRMDPELKALLDRLGLTSLSQLAGKIDTLSKSEQTLLSTVQEASTKLAATEARLVALEGDRAAKAKEAFITKLSQDGKLPPALHKWALSQDMASLEAFAADAPVIAAVDPKAEVTPKTPASAPTVLSEDEKKLCKAMQLSEKDYLATKAVLLSQPFFWAYDPLSAADEPVKESK
jgi:phage I-like protein